MPAVKKKPSANVDQKKKTAACSDDDSDQQAPPTVESQLRAKHPEVPRSPGPTRAIEDQKDVPTYLIIFLMQCLRRHSLHM